jgi:hypothetical protein
MSSDRLKLKTGEQGRGRERERERRKGKWMEKGAEKRVTSPPFLRKSASLLSSPSRSLSRFTIEAAAVTWRLYLPSSAGATYRII